MVFSLLTENDGNDLDLYFDRNSSVLKSVTWILRNDTFRIY
jgi:hypothetical protein